jgi:hypothetical protein
MKLGDREKGKENDRASVIPQTTRYEGKRYKNVLKAVEKCGVGDNGVRENILMD